MQTLINTVGLEMTKTILRSQVVYPRTASLQDKALLELEYPGKSMTMAVNAARESIELQAIDANNDVADLLALLEQFESLVILSQADCVVVYKGGFDVVKLTNTARPASGRSIYVEINSCRDKLLSFARAVNGEGKWLNVGIFVAVTVTAIFTVYRSVKN